MTMQDFKNRPELENEFRTNSKNFASTEIALISRFLDGDKTITENDFSKRNLEIVKELINSIN